MTGSAQDLLEKARQSFNTAKDLLNNGYPDFSASRSYYTMFYIASAFLEKENLSFSKHSGVISSFGKNIARAGTVPTEFHRWLISAQQLRLTGDYGEPNSVDAGQAEQQIQRAEQFMQIAEQLLNANQ
jgi:uncharacterized protein (UPF0332 family)